MSGSECLNWYPRALELFVARGLDYDAARAQALAEIERRQWLDGNERLIWPPIGLTVGYDRGANL